MKLLTLLLAVVSAQPKDCYPTVKKVYDMCTLDNKMGPPVDCQTLALARFFECVKSEQKNESLEARITRKAVTEAKRVAEKEAGLTRTMVLREINRLELE